MSQIQNTTPVVGPLTTEQPLETRSGWQRQPPDPVRRRGIITALTVAACVLPPTFAQGSASAPTGWRPTTAEPVRVVRQATQSLTVAPIEPPVAAPAAPALSWRPSYPDSARGRARPVSLLPWLTVGPLHVPRVTFGTDDIGGAVIATGVLPILQYQSLAAPIFVPPQDSSWAPKYPDRLDRAKRLVEAPSAPIAPLYVADVTQPTPTFACWPTYPARIWPTQGLHASQQQTTPARDRFDAPIEPTVTQLSWQPEYADLVPPRRGLSAARQQAWAFDRYTAPTAATVPALSWAAKYPDRIHGRHGLNASRQQVIASDRFEAPTTPAPAPALSWAPRYPDRHSVRRPLAPYTWAQPHFAVVISVPVMSWTGQYPAQIQVRRPASPALRALQVAPIQPLTLPELSLWPAHYPHQVPGKRRALAAFEAKAVAPIFVPDVTHPVTLLSWQGRYPASVDPARRSLAALESKAIAPLFVPDLTVAVPALSWRGVYADRVPPLSGLRTAQQLAFAIDARFLAPAAVVAPNLTPPVYPSRVPSFVPVAPLAAETGPVFVPGVTAEVVPLSWEPFLPDAVRRLVFPTSEQISEAAPVFVPDVTHPVPLLAWRPVYPDRLFTPVRPYFLGWLGFVRLPDTVTPVIVATTPIRGTYVVVTAINGTYVITTGIIGTVEDSD